MIAGLMVPVSYLNNVILGRVGPEVLGYYAMILLTRDFTSSFLMFGENQVVVRFFPSLKTRQRRSFILSYLLLVLLLDVVLAATAFAIPSLRSSLLQLRSEGNLFALVILFIPITILFNTASATLQSMLEMKAVALIYRTIPAWNTVGFLIVLWTLTEAESNVNGVYVVLTVVVVYLLSTIAVTIVAYEKILKDSKGPLLAFNLPKGFLSFCCFLWCSGATSFIIENFDQSYVLKTLSLGELGLYRAALSSARFVPWLPLLTIQLSFPLFSQLLNRGASTDEYYNRFIRLNLIVSGAAAIIIALNGPVILSLFGTAYRGAEEVLSVLSLGFVLYSLTAVNGSLILAKGRAGIGLICGLAGATLQVFLTYMLASEMGALGIAVARISALAVITLLGTFTVFKIAGLKIQRSLLGWITLLIGLTYLNHVWASADTLTIVWKNVAAIAAMVGFILLTRLVRLEDLMKLRTVLQDDRK